jgi:CheY-like chemotaxis protein
MVQKNKLNVILIGRDIETCILFKNAFSKLEKPCKVDHYFCLNKAVTGIDPEHIHKPDIIFLDTNNSTDICTQEVRQIRESKQFKDCSLVVYDSQSYLHDTNAIFSEGADAFINKPYYFPRLSKVLGNIVNSDWNFDRFSSDRVTYFL